MSKIPASASHASIYKTIIKGWFNKERILRICLDITFIIILMILMFWCSEIPFKRVNIDVKTLGPQSIHMDLIAVFASDTKINYDKSFHDLKNNGGVGVQMSVLAHTVYPNSHNSYVNLNKLKDTLRLFSSEESAIDSLNACIAVDFDMLYNNSRVGIFQNKDSKEWVWRDSTVKRSKYYWATRRDVTYYPSRLGVLKNAEMIGGARVVFKDTIYRDIPMAGRRPSKGWKGFLWNESLWQLCDVSQAYIGVKMNSRKSYRSGKDSFEDTATFTENGDSIGLTLEFGSPVTCSNMYPEPDFQTMTSISFTNPEKIRVIENNGVEFLVKFMHNDNIQTAKMFCITTGIALFLSLLVDKLIKFISYAWRRLAAQKKNRQ